MLLLKSPVRIIMYSSYDNRGVGRISIGVGIKNLHLLVWYVLIVRAEPNKIFRSSKKPSETEIKMQSRLVLF